MVINTEPILFTLILPFFHLGEQNFIYHRICIFEGGDVGRGSC